MSFRVINGIEIELLDEPDLFEPNSVSLKRNNVLFADNSGNIHNQRSFEAKLKQLGSGLGPLVEKRAPIKRKPVIKRKIIVESIDSVLGKRKIEDTFGPGMHDEERYGQEIPSDFFKNNIGHGVYSNQKQSAPIPTTKYNESDIINWCYKYLASKNIDVK